MKENVSVGESPPRFSTPRRRFAGPTMKILNFWNFEKSWFWGWTNHWKIIEWSFKIILIDSWLILVRNHCISHDGQKPWPKRESRKDRNPAGRIKWDQQKILIDHSSTPCFGEFSILCLLFMEKIKKTMPKSTFKNKCGHGAPEGENRPQRRRRMLRTMFLKIK